jgi:hypothetical protein
MRTILVRGSKDCPEGVEGFPTFALDTLKHFWYNQDRRIMRKTEEQKTAETIANRLNSITLNLDEVGRYLAGMPNIYYNRFMVVAESAEHEKEAQTFSQQDYLF